MTLGENSMSELSTMWYLALVLSDFWRAMLWALPYPRFLLLNMYVAGRNINASVIISELSMSHISLISGHARNSRMIFWTSAAGVWYRTIEAFIIIMCWNCVL